MARDAFSFLHLPLVAGIVLLALGVKKTLGDVDEPLKLVSAAALCGGSRSTSRRAWRSGGAASASLDTPRLVAAAACLVAAAARDRAARRSQRWRGRRGLRRARRLRVAARLSGARRLHLREVLHRPAADGASGSAERSPQRGERVHDLGRDRPITSRSTSPSCSMLRSVWVSIFCEMPCTVRRSSPWRSGPSISPYTTSAVHLSAIRSSAWRDSQFWSSTLGCAVSVRSIRSSVELKRCLLADGSYWPSVRSIPRTRSIVTPRAPAAARQRVPGRGQRRGSPSTARSPSRRPRAQGAPRVARQAAARRLITHSHPDHYGGVGELVGSAELPIVAVEGVDDVIRRDDEVKEGILRPMFGDAWPRRRTFPNHRVRDGDTLDFGGLRFTAIDLGPADRRTTAPGRSGTTCAPFSSATRSTTNARVPGGWPPRRVARNLDRLRDLPEDATSTWATARRRPRLLDWQRGYIEMFLAAIAAADFSQPESAHAEVVARVTDYLPSEDLRFLMELSIEPVAATG